MKSTQPDPIINGTFRNDYHKAVVNIVYTNQYVSNKLKELLLQEGITQQQFNILRILRGKHPESVSNRYLKEHMIDKNSDVTRIIDRLLKLKLVYRTLSNADRRQVEISITDEGLAVLSRLDIISQKEDAIPGNLTEEEVHQLNYLLNKMRMEDGE
jgi:DNA-binding MarR family transcriptional regulator